VRELRGLTPINSEIYREVVQTDVFRWHLGGAAAERCDDGLTAPLVLHGLRLP
jgi:hypothetical protein